jgi:TonB family protein
MPALGVPEKTVLMPAPGAAPPRRPPARAAASARVPPPAPNPEDVPPTVLMQAPAVARSAASPPPVPAGRPARPPAAVQTAAIPASARPAAHKGGKTARTLLLAGSALVLLVVVAAVGAFALFKSSGDVAAAAPTPEPTSDIPSITGVVRVATQPPGATVTIDGQPHGAAPLEVADLALGAHEVKVELRGFAPAVENVVLTAEAPQADLSLNLARSAPSTGMAELHSTPQGALVRIDGVAVGQTPLRQSLRLGGHAVELVKEGFEPWAGSLDVQGRGTTRVDALLRPVARATPTPEPVDVTRVYQPSEVDTQPRRVSGGSAPYPERAPRLRPGRDVTVGGTFVVSENGEITGVDITESAGDLVDDVVRAAVRNWKYSPGVRRGVKVKVRIPFKQTFRAG